MAQILCGLSYKVRSTFMTKFGTTELFILILDIPPLYTSRLVAMLRQHQRLVYKVLSSSVRVIRDLMQSGRLNRTTPPVTIFDHHVLSEGVRLFDPCASYEDAKRSIKL